MERLEKTVFLSYRRTNLPWALAIYQNLTRHGFDVFLDYNGIASGDFESVIMGNITARAHFLVLLTPSALERCAEPGDWVRREIETALDSRRNIVPLMLEGFHFSSPGIASQLTGKLAALQKYNALEVPAAYFDAAMERLRSRYLNVPLQAVLHPASSVARRSATEQKHAAQAAPAVQEEELTAQHWFERGFAAADHDERIRDYTEAIRLKPDYAQAFLNRGAEHYVGGDLDGALQDSTEAIRLQPHFLAFVNRANARKDRGDFDGSLRDYTEAIRLNPDHFLAYANRGILRYDQGDIDGALKDYNNALRLEPEDADVLVCRGNARTANGDYDGALDDYNTALRLRPNDALAFYNRALLAMRKSNFIAAAADYQEFLNCGGGVRYGNQSAIEEKIRDLRNRM